jgi:hypothetical protein
MLYGKCPGLGGQGFSFCPSKWAGAVARCAMPGSESPDPGHPDFRLEGFGAGFGYSLVLLAGSAADAEAAYDFAVLL